MLNSKLICIGKIFGILILMTLNLNGCSSKEELEFQVQQEEAVEGDNKGSETDNGAKEDVLTDTQNTDGNDGKGDLKDNAAYGEKKIIYVHICGEVLNPGVYEVEENTRLFELAEKAGGFTEEAAVDYVNQAMTVADGDKIYIPNQTEADEEGKSQLTDTGTGNEKEELLDLNTATEEELMTLPGIGASKAKKIIAYREEIGKFENIEQIMNITGIKEGVYNNIKDYVIVR